MRRLKSRRDFLLQGLSLGSVTAALAQVRPREILARSGYLALAADPEKRACSSNHRHRHDESDSHSGGILRVSTLTSPFPLNIGTTASTHLPLRLGMAGCASPAAPVAIFTIGRPAKGEGPG